MNFTTAAVAAAAAFVLSFLMGLLGGVPLVDILVRALIWAVVGFGGCLGVESLLRAVLPDLFEAPSAPAEPTEEASGPGPERVVDIIVEDEAPPRREEIPPGGEAQPAAPAAGAAPAPAPAVEVVPLPPEPGEEEMPEIGSFLDAFKPGAADAPAAEPGAPASPDVGEYAPGQWAVAPGGESPADTEVHEDPAILAKAVQTVMKRDGQGN